MARRPPTPSSMTTGGLLAAVAARFPDRPALVDEDRAVTFAALDERSNRVAHGLAALGVGRGDRVALLAANRAEWVETFFGAAKAGAVAVPLNYRLGPAEIGEQLRRTAPRVLLVDRDRLPVLEPLGDELEGATILVADEEGPGGRRVGYARWIEGASAAPPELDLGPEDVHSICATSGTTGPPRAAVLTHANVVVGTHFFSVGTFGYGRDDVFLNPTPLCHRAGWARLVQSVGVGATHVLLRRFDPDRLLWLVERHRASFAGLVPTMIRMLETGGARYDLRSLRTVLTTGEACPPAVKESLFSLLPGVELVTTYASTEAGIVTVSSSREPDYDPAATGRPIVGVDVGIRGEDGSPAPPGEPGEIAVRSGRPGAAGVMREYWCDPAATAAVFDGEWLLTGDCGFVDETHRLFLTDRKKDIIVTGGINVASKEVEAVLLAHPAVREAAVVAAPDPVYGEAVCAYVVLRPGRATTQEELVAHCRQRLASFKKPRSIRFVDALPKNAAGKILKYRLRTEEARKASQKE